MHICTINGEPVSPRLWVGCTIVGLLGLFLLAAIGAAVFSGVATLLG